MKNMREQILRGWECKGVEVRRLEVATHDTGKKIRWQNNGEQKNEDPKSTYVTCALIKCALT